MIAQKSAKALIIVLGGPQDNTVIDDISKSRMDKAIAYYKKNNSVMLLSGKCGLLKDIKVTEAKTMAKYAISKGVLKNHIFLEEKSKDTISNMYFSRLLIESKHVSFNKLIIITSDYHMKRSIYAAKKVFGNVYKKCKLEFIPSHTKLTHFKSFNIKLQEKILFSIYKNSLDKIQDGDMKAIKSFIEHKHPGYK